MCDGRVPLLCRTFSLGSIDGQESQYSGASHVRESGDHGVACLLIDTPVHHHMPLHVLMMLMMAMMTVQRKVLAPSPQPTQNFGRDSGGGAPEAACGST